MVVSRSPRSAHHAGPQVWSRFAVSMETTPKGKVAVAVGVSPGGKSSGLTAARSPLAPRVANSAGGSPRAAAQQ